MFLLRILKNCPFVILTIQAESAIFTERILKIYALVAQSVEHIVGNDEVSGPIPLGSCAKRKVCTVI